MELVFEEKEDSFESLGEWLHFRCFTDKLDVDDLVKFLEMNARVLIIVFEYAKINHRPHIHATIIPHKAMNTFRDALRKQFPVLFGNGSYSFRKVKNYDSNIKYCCKGSSNDYPEVLSSILTKEKIKYYYTEYWKVQDSILKAKAKSKEVNMGCQNDPSVVIKPKRVRVKQWAEKVTDYIIEEYSGLVDQINSYYQGDNTVDYDKIHYTLVSIILEKLGQSSKNLDEFILLRLYNAQWNAIIQRMCDNKVKQIYNKNLADHIRSKILT